MITIARYKNTRHWAVWKDNELLAVVCYKKGAKAIEHILNQNLDQPEPAKTQRSPARLKPRRLK